MPTSEPPSPPAPSPAAPPPAVAPAATPRRPATTVQVRRAREQDVPALYELVVDLARYERDPEAVVSTVEDFRAAVFAPHPLVHAHVADVGASPGTRVVGMALWYVSFSTWRGRHGIWLEDLYVRPEHRGLGLGRMLLQALATECRHRGYARLEWNVLDWNAPARDFYHSLGAEILQEWTVHRLAGAALERLATGRP